MIKISVIVPVYNVEQYLDECLESITGQSYNNIEIILVDDGATDSSGAKCDIWSDKNARIKTIHKENGGLSSARNAGTMQAKGDYIIFIDSDDYWDDRFFLEKAVDKLQETDSDLLLFGMKKVRGQDVTEIESPECMDSLQEAIKQGYLRSCACNLLVKLRLIKEEAICFREGVINEDLEWATRIYISANSAVAVSWSPYCYRQREGSITHISSAKHVNDVCDNYKRCLELISCMTQEKKDSYYYFLARAFSMLMVNVAGIDNKARRKYFPFLRENVWILDYNTRNREKIIRISVKLLGIDNTCKLLHIACRFK